MTTTASGRGTLTPGPVGVPTSSLDLHDDAVLLDPYPSFAALRDAGPVVWMERYGYYAHPRYEEVASVLSDWETFTSNEGVGFNEHFNAIKETSLHNGGDWHDEIRQVEGCPIKREPLAGLQPRLTAFAQDLVRGLRTKDSVDGITDIAMRMPIEVVTDLVGLEESVRGNFFGWGKAGFDSIGRWTPPGRCLHCRPWGSTTPTPRRASPTPTPLEGGPTSSSATGSRRDGNHGWPWGS